MRTALKVCAMGNVTQSKKALHAQTAHQATAVAMVCVRVLKMYQTALSIASFPANLMQTVMITTTVRLINVKTPYASIRLWPMICRVPAAFAAAENAFRLPAPATRAVKMPRSARQTNVWI